MEDTIAAISTALGVGAISIIRVSGSKSIEIVNKIFKGKDLTTTKTHTIHYGKIINNNQEIDEVLVSIMKSPKTFTTEDIVEINCHGGIATTNKVLELLLTYGCRLAEPGEFTKRAFLNGRIDLEQAEGIMDLINSKTEPARSLAINQLNGNVSKLIRDLRSDLIKILANIEVNIDYPEYEDNPIITNEKVLEEINNLQSKMTKILENSKNSKIIKEGITTSIIGKPNVGKSSLLNKLLNEEKAIVTDIEGTTRDIVEGTINLNGIILNIIDTAGIRKTDDVIEQMGVQKSLELIEKSDLILYLLNNNDILSPEDKNLLNQIKPKNHIIIINKVDLERKLDIESLEKDNIIYMSLKNDQGIDDLTTKIKKLFNIEKLEKSDLTYLTNARSIVLLNQATNKMLEVQNGLKSNQPIDMVEIDIKSVWSTLGEIIGETYEDELINQLFSQFCLGK